MKCTNKKISLVLCFLLLINLCGCEKAEVVDPYNLHEDAYTYGLVSQEAQTVSKLYGRDLCVTDGVNIKTDAVDSQIALSGGVFNLDTGETLYAQNIFDQVYPASTTKILTAYIAITYGDLNQVVTVSENACDQESDSSVCGLNPGDVMTLEQLLYGLMLRSGNDAAVAIAETISGSVESFAELMNSEAHRMGATHSHFVTPNGLHDDDHYTTTYDMYLIFDQAIKLPEFVEILQTVSYDVIYQDVNGEEQTQTWANTCGYLSGAYAAPDQVTVIGGKTGTTGAAKYCLVLLSENAKNERIVSIVFHADSRGNLYYLMNEMLSLTE